MRDGCAKGRFSFGAFWIDVNPLVIKRGVGKLIDAFLRDFEPVGNSNFTAN